MMPIAAWMRMWLGLLAATVSGYTSACGCASPTSDSRLWISRRTRGDGAVMRAMICGITSSHVSTITLAKPSLTACDTSSWWPYLNHSVSRRSVSCRLLPLASAIERKKPCTDGTMLAAIICGVICSFLSSWCEMISKFASAHACHALYQLRSSSVARR